MQQTNEVAKRLKTEFDHWSLKATEVIVCNQSKFMAVELVGGKVRFSWRVGVETNTMETSEEITFHDELTWYRVRAER